MSPDAYVICDYLRTAIVRLDMYGVLIAKDCPGRDQAWGGGGREEQAPSRGLALHDHRQL